MEQLPGNSHRQQKEDEAPPKVEKVVRGEVSLRKKPWNRRLTEKFLANRADVVAEHVWDDVLLPSLKNTVADGLISFVESMIFPQGTGRGRASSIVRTAINQSIGTYNTPQVNYNSIGRPVPGQPMAQNQVISQQGRARHDFKEIIIPTRVEAEEVLGQLLFRIREYNAVTVADLYELCGITPNYTDDKFGWVDIRGAGVLMVRGGFVLDLPRPVELD